METVQIQINENIAMLTINRTKQLNALNTQVLIDLEQALLLLDLDTIRCLVITGSGDKAFVAGADITEMNNMNWETAKAFIIRGSKLMQMIDELPIPVIAAINGYALGGGCELALSCDIRLASEKSIFGFPETTLGITPGFGGMQRLARLIGAAKAKEMIFTAKSIDATCALSIGLVNQIFTCEKYCEQVNEFARQIAANAPIALRAAKTAIVRDVNCDREAFIISEAEHFANTFCTDDRKNAMRAYVEKSVKSPFLNR